MVDNSVESPKDFPFRTRPMPPAYEGVIPIQSSDEPIRYRIQPCFHSDYTPRQIHDLAMRTCRISNAAMEILRHRQPGAILAKFAERECIQRIEQLRAILDEGVNDFAIMRRRRIYPPIEPKWVNGMLKSETLLDVSTALAIAGHDYIGTIVLVRDNGRWICRHLDIG